LCCEPRARVCKRCRQNRKDLGSIYVPSMYYRAAEILLANFTFQRALRRWGYSVRRRPSDGLRSSFCAHATRRSFDLPLRCHAKVEMSSVPGIKITTVSHYSIILSFCNVSCGWRPRCFQGSFFSREKRTIFFLTEGTCHHASQTAVAAAAAAAAEFHHRADVSYLLDREEPSGRPPLVCERAHDTRRQRSGTTQRTTLCFVGADLGQGKLVPSWRPLFSEGQTTEWRACTTRPCKTCVARETSSVYGQEPNADA